MPANYNQYPDSDIEKRVRFFDGQFLKDQDFIDDQKYHIDRLRRSQRLLRVAGICDGLEVTVREKVLAVQNGTAIDTKGRTIVLPSDRALNLSDRKGTVDIYIAYSEEESDVTQESNALDPTETGAKGATRWWENPVLVAAEDPSKAPADGLLIARVDLDKNQVDNTVCDYSGIRFPSPENPPELRSRGHYNPNTLELRGHLSVSGNVGIGTADPIQTLDVRGRIHLENGVIQRGGDAITNTSDLGLYSQTSKKWMRFVTNNAPIRFFTDSGRGTTARLAIEANGNVGIGTAAPKAKLAIAGGLHVGGDEDPGSGNAIVAGNTTTNRLLALERVGIGTTNPNSSLHVVGRIDVMATNEGQTAVGYIKSTRRGDNAANADLRFGTDNGDTMVVHDSKVGIGTTSPTQRLSVYGGNLVLQAQDNTKEQNVLFQNSGGAYTWRIYRVDAGGNSADLKIASGLNTDYSKLSDRLTIDKDGNVGIGATPEHKLQANGNAAIDRVFLGDAGHGNNWASFCNTGAIGTESYALMHSADGTRTLLNAKAGGSLEFRINNSDKVRIDKDGNVGIGTTTPGQKLQVSGNAAIGSVFLGDAGHGSNWAAVCHADVVGTGTYALLQKLDGKATIINTATGGSIRLRIDNSDKAVMNADGKVAIGTTSFTHLFNVGGTLAATSFVGVGALVKGMILMWSGTIKNIPTGWKLCDGEEGTPNLKGRFIVGYDAADSDYNNIKTVNSSERMGGAKKHALSTNEMPEHTHGGKTDEKGEDYKLRKGGGAGGTHALGKVKAGGDYWIRTKHTHSFTTGSAGKGTAHENRPPYYVLAYIIYVGV